MKQTINVAWKNQIMERTSLNRRFNMISGSEPGRYSLLTNVVGECKDDDEDEDDDDDKEEVEVHRNERWFNKVLDMEEAKTQILFSLPMILTNVAYYSIPVTSVMFAGHLGELELAAANLANSWSTVTGLAFLVGLTGALETLCGQSYGAKMYRKMGMYLQSSCIISLFLCTMISVLWCFSGAILTLLHQDPEIVKAAALYLKLSIPGLFAYALLQNMLKFLQTQYVVAPLFVCSIVPSILHVGISFALVKWTPLAFRGAALSASISLWISAIMLGFYLLRARRCKDTWNGFSIESLHYVPATFRLGLPCAAMVCFEYWALEILVLLSGLMPDPEITTSLTAMCVNTEAIAYMIASGLSAAASTRVSNELGAGNPERAKNAMNVALKLCVVLAVCVVSVFGFGSHFWAALFSESPVIVSQFAAMTKLLVISIFIDFIQGIISGVTRGCGLQHAAVAINFGTYYFIGMTIAALLGFKLKLHVKGLWMGLICGLACQACGLLLLAKLTKWVTVDLSDDTKKPLLMV